MPIVTCQKCSAKNRVDDRAANLQPVCGKCGTKLEFAGTPLVVTDATFARSVLRVEKPVLVDCWAPWCGPCRTIGPIVDELAAQSGGRYVVAKLNVDENPRIATEFQIDSIPTLLIFKGGAVVDRIVGLQPKQAVVAKLQKYL